MQQGEPTFLASQMPLMTANAVGAWSFDTVGAATKNEVFCGSDDAAGIGFALALAARHGPDESKAETKPWLWVQDKAARRRSGMPYLHGLSPKMREGLHYVSVATAEDALFALEEGLRCAELSCVIGELSGDPKALNFTASRRLAAASEAHGVPLYLLRHDASPTLSAARLRWRVDTLASLPHCWNSKAPGAPQCTAELFKARRFRPSTWQLAHEGDRVIETAAPNHLDLDAESGNQSLAAAGGS